MLNPELAARLFGEAASNAVPGLDVIGDAALARDAFKLAEDVASLKTDTDVAVAFARQGPRSLEELRVVERDEAFRTFDAFKKLNLVKHFGPAGNGYEYLQIVEQVSGGNLPASEIQSTRNIVRIPRLLHEEINAAFEKTVDPSGRGPSLRASLKGKSFDEQWREGLRVMRKVGLLE